MRLSRRIWCKRLKQLGFLRTELLSVIPGLGKQVEKIQDSPGQDNT
jgi:hypothetical protein